MVASAAGSDGAGAANMPEAESGPPQPAEQAPAAEQPAGDAGAAAVAGAGEQQDVDYWFSEDEEEEGDWEADAEDLDADAEEDVVAAEWEGDLVEEVDEDWIDVDGDMEEDLDQFDEEDWEDMVQIDNLSVSSEEPEGEAQGAEGLARHSAGRAFHAQPATYRMPTENHHFQSADALCVADPASDGSVVAAVFDRDGVAAYRLPPPGQVSCLGLSQPPAVRLGGFQAPRDIFALAISPDGSYIAAGGDAGVVTIYTVDPRAPPRPQLPQSRVVPLSSLIYFYTPLQLPLNGPPMPLYEDEVEYEGVAAAQQPGGSAAGASEQAGPSGQGVNAQGSRGRQAGEGAAEQHIPASEVGAAIAALDKQMLEVEAAAARNQLLRALINQDLTHAMEPGSGPGGQQQQELQQAGDQEAGPSRQGPAAAAAASEAASGQQREHEPRQAAAVMMGCMLALGFQSEQAARMNAYDNDNAMCNGLRFGLVGGKLRLLAAEQSGYLYVFEVPAAGADCSSGSRSAARSSGCLSDGTSSPAAAEVQPLERAMLCSSLGQPSPHWCMRPVNVFSTEQLALGARVTRLPPEAVGSEGWWNTAAIGPFGHPCNFAAASPDGRWIALTTDSQRVSIVDQQAGFSWQQVDFDIGGDKSFMAPDVASGSQYAAWNASSTLLAISSDTLHAVFVIDPLTLQRVYSVEGHRRPCLPLLFAPWSNQQLVYAEETKHVWSRDVREEPSHQDVADDLEEARPSTQLLRVPLTAANAGAVPALNLHNRRRRVTGMAATRQGDLLVATKQGTVMRYLASMPWRLQQHALWPPAFRTAVRELVLCANRKPAEGQQQQQRQGAGLWSLPHALLLQVVAQLAGQRSDWLPDAPPPPQLVQPRRR